MKTIARYIAYIICVMTSLISTAQAQSPYAWEYRPVYIFAPTETTADLTTQIDLFMQRRTEMLDRNMALIAVTDKAEVIFGPDQPYSSAELRRAYNIDPTEFTVILVGKDTGVKRRHVGVIDPDLIFIQIDGMPMRRQEMRLKSIDRINDPLKKCETLHDLRC